MSQFRFGGFQSIPYVLKNIIIINVLVFLLQSVVPGDFIGSTFELHYWQSSLFKPWQLVTHMFMHGSIAHIFFNMFGLYNFGRILEDRWGPKRFLIFYLVCGVGAAICYEAVLSIQLFPLQQDYVAFMHNATPEGFLKFANAHHLNFNANFLDAWRENPGSMQYGQTAITQVGQVVNDHLNVGMVGASGALFGILFGFGYLFPDVELMIIPIPIPIKAKWLVTGYGLIELFSGIANRAGDNVAHFAHVGGLIFGFIMIKIWRERAHRNFY